MVFETLVADLLNRFLGDFVDNLDASQLNIGIWGDVKLNNLEIKNTALDELDLPIKLKYGFLDNLVLKIPWKNLYTEPVLANIDGLYLIVVPNVGVVYNKEKAEKRDQETKQKELLKLEEKRKYQRKPKDPAADTFTEKMIAHLIKNLQVTIKNIHIRFEDKYTNRQHPFVAGFTLEGLDFQTTDKHWKAAILNNTVSLFHKLISMQNLAVYWNSNSKFISDLSEKQEIRKALKEIIATENDKPEDYKYIVIVLQLTTMEAKLAINQKPESDGFTIPKIDLNIEVNELALAISTFQYQSIQLVLEAQERFNIAARYLKYRPNLIEYRGHYRKWWHFAYKCILEENIRRKRRNWSWKRMKDHRKLVKIYQDAWMKKLTEQNLGRDVINIIKNAEHELDVFNLNIARQQAEMKVDRKGLTRIEDQGWTAWAYSWWGGSSNTKEHEHLELEGDIIAKIQQEMTPVEKQKLFDAIDYHGNTPPPDYPEEYIENKIRLHLTSLIVTIEESLEWKFNELSINVEQRQSFRTIHMFFSSLIVETLYEINCQLPTQKFVTELNEFVAILSYSDLLILYNLYNGIPFNDKKIQFEKIFFTAEQLCFTFLDEFHGATIPMLRLMLSTIQIETYSEDKILSYFILSSDYFNQQHFDWEPFLEPWLVQNFRIRVKPDCIRFWLKSDSPVPLDFNVTQTFCQQFKSAQSKWPVHKEDVVQELQAPHHFNIDGEINIPAGFDFEVFK
uniref:Chorein N-terminal domain-containing protein n=1 Tax=Panagrolaimus superbus TaxID=310955 RepID=A0A914YP04_9BILA